MMDIGAVAEAMEAEYEAQMAADNDGSPLPYIDWLNMAQAAIDALQLTREQQTLADGSGGISTNWKTGETTVHSRPCTRMSRYVTPWVVVDGAAL